MAHQEIAYPGPHHSYVYHLLPELGEEAMKFKKIKIFIKKLVQSLIKKVMKTGKELEIKNEIYT